MAGFEPLDFSSLGASTGVPQITSEQLSFGPSLGIPQHNFNSLGENNVALGQNAAAVAGIPDLLNPQTQGPGTEGFNWGSMEGWGNLLGGLGDIGTAYMAYKNYGLAKDQFKVQTAFANRNLENQAIGLNAESAHRAAARNTFAGNNSHKATVFNGKPINV